MAANLRVVDRGDISGAHNQRRPRRQPNDPTYKLLEAKDCLTCHSIDGSEGIGPTFKGIYGRATKLKDGIDRRRRMTAYLRESIVKPGRQDCRRL